MKKFYAFLAAAAVALGASAQSALDGVDFYLIGGFNGWTSSDANCKFTATETEGVYVLEYEGTLTNGFKINNGGWDDPEFNFGSSGARDKVVLGEPFDLSIGNDSKNIEFADVEGVENPVLTLDVADLEAPTLTIVGKTAEVEYTYYLCGSLPLAEWANPCPDYEFVKDGDVYVLNNVEFVAAEGAELAEGEFKVASDGWTKEFGSGAEMLTLSNNNLVLEMEGTGNMAYSLTPGAYDFVLDVEARTLTVTEAAGIQGVTVDAAAPAVYYNLQGVRVANPENGLFIVRQGGKATKVLVK